MLEKFMLIGGTYDYDYADDEKKWELVRYDKEAEEWECIGVYCVNEFFAHELKDLLNKAGGKA